MKCSICNEEIKDDEETISETIVSPDDVIDDVIETAHLACIEGQMADDEANNYYYSTRGV
jgi:hypothetical protein